MKEHTEWEQFAIALANALIDDPETDWQERDQELLITALGTKKYVIQHLVTHGKMSKEEAAASVEVLIQCGLDWATREAFNKSFSDEAET